MSVYEYIGIRYESRRLMCLARREHYVTLLQAGYNFTQAAKIVGVSKRTGKVWRNGRTRATGRDETATTSPNTSTTNTQTVITNNTH